MNVADTFAKAKADGRSVLIGYLPVGFPTVDASIAAMLTMVSAGVDIVEVGLPYSDPVIDGPTIQAAADTALAAGFRTRDVFRAVEAISDAGAPAVVMTYWNPVERYGVDRFAADLANAGGAGLITPDLIPDEAGEWLEASDAHNLDRVFLVAPSSTEARIASTVASCRGFVYATSVMGVTGARGETSQAAPELVRRVRAATDLPIGIGLGVSNGAQAAEVASYADAVIVGSALVSKLAQDDGVAKVWELATELAAGVRR